MIDTSGPAILRHLRRNSRALCSLRWWRRLHASNAMIVALDNERNGLRRLCELQRIQIHARYGNIYQDIKPQEIVYDTME